MVNSKVKYICPITREALFSTPNGLRRADGTLYPFLDRGRGDIPDFIAARDRSSLTNDMLAAYDSPVSVEVYRNFLDWLFATFEQDEMAFRADLIGRLRLERGDRVLVTGCGLGEDLSIIAERIGPDGVLFAQDLSKSMVLAARQRFADSHAILQPSFSVGDALTLPFADGEFDAVFHFGGINLFGDMKGAVREMTRVARPGGRVAFGDEGVAPWLRETEYGRIAINNINLWRSEVPLPSLPQNATDVRCTWVLGNCFYMIDFVASASGPVMNLDVPHKGRRGGTARTRYFGQIEGIDPTMKAAAMAAAQREGVSGHEWLERAVREALGKAGN